MIMTMLGFNKVSTGNIHVPWVGTLVGMTKCEKCLGTGVSNDLKDCDQCRGLGKVEKLSNGEVKPYGLDFIRGYKDAEKGIAIERCPFILKFRAKPWREGWEAFKR